MELSTARRHAPRIDRVVARLQLAVAAGLEPPGLAELAAIAHLSPYHFHRVYRALTGEPIGASLARMRLSRALHLLSDPSRDVTDVALAVGYGSAQALARVFRDQLESTPGALRADPERRKAMLSLLARPSPKTADASPLQVEIVDVEALDVVALRVRGRFDDLDVAFGRLFEWAGQHALLDGDLTLVGIPRNDRRDEAEDACEFDCALGLPHLPSVPAPFQRLTLPGGRQARLRHVGPYEGLEAATDRLLEEWWIDSGEALREAPVHYLYLDDPETVPAALLRADICLPLA